MNRERRATTRNARVRNLPGRATEAVGGVVELEAADPDCGASATTGAPKPRERRPFRRRFLAAAADPEEGRGGGREPPAEAAAVDVPAASEGGGAAEEVPARMERSDEGAESRRTMSSSSPPGESSESSRAMALRVVEARDPPVDPPAESCGDCEVLMGGVVDEAASADDPRESEDEPRRRPNGGMVCSIRSVASRDRASRGSGCVGSRGEDAEPKAEAAVEGRSEAPEDDVGDGPPGMGLGGGLAVDRPRLREACGARPAGEDERPGGGSPEAAAREVEEIGDILDVANGGRSARGGRETSTQRGNQDQNGKTQRDRKRKRSRALTGRSTDRPELGTHFLMEV